MINYKNNKHERFKMKKLLLTTLLLSSIQANQYSLDTDKNTKTKHTYKVEITDQDKLWEEVKKVNTIKMYKAYIRKYPNGIYNIIAENFIEELSEETKKDMPKWVLRNKSDHLAYGIVIVDKEYYDTETYQERVAVGEKLAYEKLVRDYHKYSTYYGFKQSEFRTDLYEMPNGDLYVMVYYQK